VCVIIELCTCNLTCCAQVFLAGLAAQLVSFLVFTCIYLLFLLRVRKHRPEVWSVDKDKTWNNAWRALTVALFTSCIGVLVSLSTFDSDHSDHD